MNFYYCLFIFWCLFLGYSIARRDWVFAFLSLMIVCGSYMRL